MPTLIRFFAVLLVLAGIAFAGMLALSIFVNPTPKEVRVRIPDRELGAGVEQARKTSDPLNILPIDREPVVTTTTEPVDEPPLEPGTREVDIPE